MFLFQASLDVTETFKQQKGRLVEEGFSPSAVSEALYFLDESEKTYVPLTKNLFDDIVSGQIRLWGILTSWLIYI